jgi:hypothetical protein
VPLCPRLPKLTAGRFVVNLIKMKILLINHYTGSLEMEYRPLLCIMNNNLAVTVKTRFIGQ